MDIRKPPDFTLELTADRMNVKDVVKGILHTIFFHRFFTPLHPATQDVLDVTLPYVSEEDIETLIDERTTALMRQLDAASAPSSPYSSPKGGRSTLVVQFLERKRRKGWFIAKADEETVWENWIIHVTLTSARSGPEAARNRRQMESSLEKASMNVVNIVNKEKNHIPPITTNETNPFPYQILINPKNDGWSQKTGIF